MGKKTVIVDPKQCKTCRYRMYWPDQTAACDLMGITGICRLTSDRKTNPDGSCRWYEVQTDKRPYVRPVVLPASERIDSDKKKMRGHPPKSAVVMLDKDFHIVKQFRSMYAAAFELGVSPDAVSRHCNWRQKAKRKPESLWIHGYTFRFVDDEDVKKANGRQ